MTINLQQHSDGSITFEDFVNSNARLCPGKVIEVPINGPHSASRFAIVEMHLSEDATMHIYHAKCINVFVDARVVADLLSAKAEEASKGLEGFPRGAMGLTPDVVKFSREFREAKFKFECAFASSRLFNQFYVKTWKKEIAAYRFTARSTKQNSGS